MKTVLVNFAAGDKYKRVQEVQNKNLDIFVDDVFSYTDSYISDIGLLDKYKKVFTHNENMHGWYWAAWKSVIILDALRKVNDGDLILYSDVTDLIVSELFFDWFKFKTIKFGGRFFNKNYHRHGDWTKRDCFILMDCDKPEYWSARQLEAGTLGFIKNPENIEFVKIWRDWCEQEQVIAETPSTLGKNLPGYKAHRCDQSILTNLQIKYEYETELIENLSRFVIHNYYDDNPI